jgi:single-stranded DNA-binding protein
MEKNNQVTLVGEIVGDFEFEYEVYGERFYRMFVGVNRLRDDACDVIPCVISERLIDVTRNYDGYRVGVVGQYRSHNRFEGEKSRLILSVFVRELWFQPGDRDENEILLRGYVCKKPVYRVTPLGREISDLCIAVNRQYHKTDYIPCICWGRNARYARDLFVGDMLDIAGRIQSREYEKDGKPRIAYEVSVRRMELIWEDDETSN